MRQLYRAIVHKNKLGKPFTIEVFDSVLDAVKRDNNLAHTNEVILGNVDSNVLEKLVEGDLEFVALVKSDGFRLRDVVYYYIKES